jgi:hypothetical protein
LHLVVIIKPIARACATVVSLAPLIFDLNLQMRCRASLRDYSVCTPIVCPTAGCIVLYRKVSRSDAVFWCARACGVSQRSAREGESYCIAVVSHIIAIITQREPWQKRERILSGIYSTTTCTAYLREGVSPAGE